MVMWFRRDLRLADHPALCAAAEGSRVVGLFVDDPAFDRAGGPRKAYLEAALASLNASMGGALVRRRGNPAAVVTAVAAECNAHRVFVSRDYSPYGRRRDAEVADTLRVAERALTGVGSPYAVMPGSVAKADDTAYRVFTPFSKAWLSHGWEQPLAAPDVRWRPSYSDEVVAASALPDECIAELGGIGEAAVANRWDTVLPTLTNYADVRDQPGVDGTSRLSAALRWGIVHPRQLLCHLGDERGHAVFRNELAWREFYADVLYRTPESAWNNLDPKMMAMPVDADSAARKRFERWAAGTTGYPIVDAGMRQLRATGWMHNRVRMLVASFLVKDLHLPWQWGAAHFMRHLVDGDLASNAHGWQWTAGTGTDAAPYFRIFNPTTQGLRFDPEGEYVRRWVPELRHVAGGAVHEPGACGEYVAPMVDHAVERDEALARLASIKRA